MIFPITDRKEGIHIVHEVDDAYQKLSAFVAALENQIVQHHRLIGMLEQAKSFYGQQLRDATVVDDVCPRHTLKLCKKNK